MNTEIEAAKAAQPPLTPADAFERFLRLSVADGSASIRTVRAYREGLQAFLAFCAIQQQDPRVTTFDDVQAYRAFLVLRGYSRATIKLRLTAVRILYQALQRWGVRLDNPAAGVKAPKKARHDYTAIIGKALSVEETRRFLDVFPRSWTPQAVRDTTILRLMLYHGLRAEEVTTLHQDALDWDGYTYLKVRGKGDKERVIVLCHETRQDLLAWARVSPCAAGPSSPPLFYRLDRAGYAPLSVRAIERITDHYLGMAGLKKPQRSAHALRHTHAMLATLAGVKPQALANELGHADTTTTDLYTMAAAQFQDNPAAHVSAAINHGGCTMSEKSLQIGTGKDPKGQPVTYHEEDRGFSKDTRGASATPVLVVRNAKGEKVTHSDSLAGLKKAGYTVDEAKAPEVKKKRSQVVLTKDEGEQLRAFRAQLSAAQDEEVEELLAEESTKDLRPFAEFLTELDQKYPLTSVAGSVDPTRIPVPAEKTAA